MEKLATRVKEIYHTLHQIPEIGFQEFKTSAYLAGQLRKAGYEVQTGLADTGVIGVLKSGKPGPTLALRADMDALEHIINGETVMMHTCGHDAHSAMVMTVAEAVAGKGLTAGTLKIIFQPAEEKLFGAVRMIEAGAIDDVDMILGVHLRPMECLKLGQARPAIYNGASTIMDVAIQGVTAHGARPHQGINAINAAAAAIFAVNSLSSDPMVPASIKVTTLHAGGAANAIPASAQMTLDVRAQDNVIMDELIHKAMVAIQGAAASFGATADVSVRGGVPAAVYDAQMVEQLKKAITQVLGKEGLLEPVSSPGGEDFHFYVKRKPTIKAGYMGLGANVVPGLHHPDMKFDQDALINGVRIFLHTVNNILGVNEFAY